MLVTKDDYFKSRGIDLTKELNGSTDNPSAEVNLFLVNQEIWLKNYIELNFEPCGIDNEDFINNALKEALMSQIDYALIHGNKSITNDQLSSNVLAPNTFIILKKNGMANNKHNTKRMPMVSLRRK